MITQSIIAGPMVALYIFSILVAFLFGKERKKRKAKKEEKNKSKAGLAG
jgi:Sec-independent protein secretion pathway component TatC